MLEFASAETAVRRRELEGPEKVGGLLEVGADSVDLVNKILDGDDTVLAQALLNELIIGLGYYVSSTLGRKGWREGKYQGDSLAVDLSVTTLVDQLTNRLEVRFTVGDPWLNNTEHLSGGLGKADKDTIVDLEETEELKDLARLGRNLVDTVLNHKSDVLMT